MITVDFNRLKIKPGCRILDIGCGSGRHTCAAMRFRKVLTMGVDLSFDNVLETRSRLKLHETLGECNGGTWWISVADILALPFKDNFFDIVICAEVLEHLPDAKTAVTEIVRVLKPGRNLVVSVPRYLPERICWALSESYHSSDNGHVRIYRKRELIGLLKSAGARPWHVHFAHSLHTPYWWLKCWVGPTRENSKSVNLYHRFLVWDMMKKPWLFRLLEQLLNPIIGKSIVIYSKKNDLYTPVC